jgi:hypothetical protein
MFYSSTDKQYIQEGTAFQVAGIQYPSNWLNLSSPADKAAIGLEEVVATNSPANDKFYWVSDSLNGAALTYTNTPKDLDTCKSNEVSATNAAVFSLLSPTDYIDIRNLRDPSYKPEWMTWRDTIRTQAQAQVEAINACTTIDELAALPNVNWAKDPNAPVDPA